MLIRRVCAFSMCVFAFGIGSSGCGRDEEEEALAWSAAADVPAAVADDAAVALPSLTVQGRREGSITLASMNVDVKVFGRLARTEVTQVFQSHLPMQSEGTYEMTLPEGAVLSRLAMDVDGTMMEGELVEKERAREVYESIVRSQKDPALLEWQGGNRFKMQVFPIPANGTKTIILAYEQVLPVHGKRTEYVLALPSVAKTGNASVIERFSFHLDAQRAGDVVNGDVDRYAIETRDGTATFLADKLAPRGPLRVMLAGTHSEGAPWPLVLTGRMHDERTFLVDVTPDLPVVRGAASRDVVIAIDTSRGIGNTELRRALEVTKGIVDAARSAGRTARVVHGDLRARSCALDDDKLPQCLASIAATGAGGATNLEALFVEATKAAVDLDAPAIVVFSDGAATLGELDGDVLRARFITALRNVSEDARVLTVAVGHAPDTDFLSTLAAEGRAPSLRMTPTSSVAGTIEAVVHALRAPMFTDVKVRAVNLNDDDDNTDDISLTVVPSYAAAGAGAHLRPGEPLAIVGRVPAKHTGAIELELTGEWNGDVVKQRIDVSAAALDDATAPSVDLVSRFWARGHIASLERKGVGRERVVAASLRYGVMSKATSFLVLENDAAYKRFQIDRLREEQRQQKAQELAAKDNANAASSVRNLQKSNESLAQRIAADVVNVPGEPREEESQVWAASPEGPALFDAKLASLFGGASGGGADGDAMKVSSALGGLKGAPLQKRREPKVGDAQAEEAYAAPVSRNAKPDSDGATITQGTPIILGSLDKEVVQRIVQEHGRDVSVCASKAQANTTAINGVVRMKWVVNGEGRVTQAQVEEERASPREGATYFGRCLAAHIKTWRFPKPKGGGIAIISFSFGVGTHARRYGVATIDHRTWLEEQLQNGTLSDIDRSTLIGLRIRAGALAQADALFAQSRKLWIAPTPSAALLANLKDMDARRRYADDVERAVLNVLDQTDDAPRAATELIALERSSRIVEVMSARLRASEAEKRIAEVSDVLRLLVVQYGRAPRPEHIYTAQGIVRALREADWSDAQVYAALSRHDDVARALSKETAAAALAVLRATPKQERINAALLSRYVDLSSLASLASLASLGSSSDEQPQSEVPTVLEELCVAANAPVQTCITLIQKHVPRGRASAEALLASLRPRLLDDVRAQRREDLVSHALLLQEVALLDERGDEEAALRVLSEMVEVVPHDAGVRDTYARTLLERHRRATKKDARLLNDACEAYGHATQLQPARRDLFRTMIALRRDDDDVADDVRECIVKGVSRLPVQRAVSLVLTWEDPTADVDLHVEGPSGEVVFFKHKEGKDGGLLYYDVMDGFGPEIYTLGQREAGEYRVSVVYYAGRTDDIDARLTILENAGTPAETRRDIDIELGKPDKNDRKTVAVLRP